MFTVLRTWFYICIINRHIDKLSFVVYDKKVSLFLLILFANFNSKYNNHGTTKSYCSGCKHSCWCFRYYVSAIAIHYHCTLAKDTFAMYKSNFFHLYASLKSLSYVMKFDTISTAVFSDINDKFSKGCSECEMNRYREVSY